MRLVLLLFHMYTKNQSRTGLEHIRHNCMVLERVIKDIGSLILLKKEKVLGREGQFHGPGQSCTASVNSKLSFITMDFFIDQGMLERDRIHLSTEEKSILDTLVRGAAIGRRDDNPHMSEEVDKRCTIIWKGIFLSLKTGKQGTRVIIPIMPTQRGKY